MYIVHTCSVPMSNTFKEPYFKVTIVFHISMYAPVLNMRLIPKSCKVLNTFSLHTVTISSL